jgi:hypothetical protein
MRRSSVIFLLGFAALTVFESDTEACGRRRWRCHQQPCPIVCEPSPFAISAQRAQAFSTKSFKSPGGLVYRIQLTNYKDLHEESQGEISTEAVNEEDFTGKDRKVAKTSIVEAAPEKFMSIEKLLNTLASDKDMLDMGIPKTPESDRVSVENRNVTVDAFIYAASKEKDNDFHIILGGSDASDTGQFMNAEISGLPKGAFRPRLTVPRKAFKDYFGDSLPGRSYSIYDPPIPVRVTGSLFFDVDHLAGVVGPTGFKPQTAWEIHPISSIEMEP